MDVDTLIAGATIITIDGDRRVIVDGALAIRGDRIVAVGKREVVEREVRAKTITDACWQGAKAIADTHGAGISAHMSPAALDTAWSVANTGQRPIEHLGSLGVLGGNVNIVHTRRPCCARTLQGGQGVAHAL